MADLPESGPSELSRLAAQRNAAIAAAIFLTGVLICAGWALETYPRRKAEVYRLDNAALRDGYFAMQKELKNAQLGLSNNQAALVEAQKALRITQEALKNTEEALHRDHRTAN
jgi:hypothetical protein